MKSVIHIAYVTIFLMTGCSHPQMWEKTGGNQHAFDLDSLECKSIARQVSLQQSATGKNTDPASFSKAYIQCLDAKGWKLKTAASGHQTGNGPETVRKLTETTSSNSMTGFRQTITVPDTFTLLANKQFQSSETIVEQFFWQGEDSSFINVFFQKNIAGIFEKVPYPVLEPYILYTFGEGEKAKANLQWATFWGLIGSNWVMGTGAYYNLSKKERIILVITKPLDPPAGPIPENVTLARNQFLQIEQFSDQWRLWLNQQFQKGPGLLKQAIQALHFGSE